METSLCLSGPAPSAFPVGGGPLQPTLRGPAATCRVHRRAALLLGVLLARAEGSRAGVRACGCVHERGPGATHTHTHTLKRPHTNGALGRAPQDPRVRPTPALPGSCSVRLAARLGVRPGAGQGATAGFPPHPARLAQGQARAGERRGEERRGRRVLPLGRACARGSAGRGRVPGPAPPRRQARRGRGRRAGRSGGDPGAGGLAVPPCPAAGH